MSKLEELKQKFDDKIDKEYEEFIEELKQCPKQVILERAYEKVSKEEMVYKIQDKDYTVSDLKALLKTDLTRLRKSQGSFPTRRKKTTNGKIRSSSCS